MANNPTTLVWLTGDRKITVEMSAEDVTNSLGNAANTLARLPTGDGRYEYVNPAHVISARETTDDPGPQVHVH
jgi:hypothetical protein